MIGYLLGKMGPDLVMKRPPAAAGAVLELEAEADPLEAFPLSVEIILAESSYLKQTLHINM